MTQADDKYNQELEELEQQAKGAFAVNAEEFAKRKKEIKEQDQNADSSTNESD